MARGTFSAYRIGAKVQQMLEFADPPEIENQARFSADLKIMPSMRTMIIGCVTPRQPVWPTTCRPIGHNRSRSLVPYA